MKTYKNADTFYGDLLDLLIGHNVSFMIGGTYAFTAYTGIERPTKDMDIFATVEDYPKILRLCSDAGFKTALHDEYWIAKIHSNKYYTDVIYAEKNGLVKVTKEWLDNAHQGTLFGHQVKLVPPEEMIRSKAYIQHRERHDGADVVHLILQIGKALDWRQLLDKMEPHYEIILGHILTFLFVYPAEKGLIPQWVLNELLDRAKKEFAAPPFKERITRGLLISTQYEVGVAQWGYNPIKKL
jgi:hypothetical protein